MGTQEQVDADTAAVQQVAADLATAQSTLQAELDTLAQEHPQVNLAPLNEAVAKLDPAVRALAALTPQAPAPPAAAPAQ